MTISMGPALLAVVVSIAPPGQRLNLDASSGPWVTHSTTCLRYPAGDQRIKLDLSSRIVAMRDNAGAESHEAVVQGCLNLQAISETQLPATVTPPKGSAGQQRGRPESAHERFRRLYATAQAMYVATSKDAETFTAALLLPEVRRKIETALHQKLSNEQCRELARQAEAEALYWYKYMQGLERGESGPDDR